MVTIYYIFKNINLNTSRNKIYFYLYFIFLSHTHTHFLINSHLQIPYNYYRKKFLLISLQSGPSSPGPLITPCSFDGIHVSVNWELYRHYIHDNIHNQGR